MRFFFWDNSGRKDIIESFRSDVFEPRTSTRNEPFSILNCLDATKFVSRLRVFTLIETICANICLKSRLKNAKVHVRLTWDTQKRRSLNSLITGLTDGRMGRLVSIFFRVVQIVLDIPVKVSLKDYWHLPREVHYSLIFLVFVLGQSLTLFMRFEWSSDSALVVHLRSFPPPPPRVTRVSNGVICGSSFNLN